MPMHLLRLHLYPIVARGYTIWSFQRRIEKNPTAWTACTSRGKHSKSRRTTKAPEQCNKIDENHLRTPDSRCKSVQRMCDTSPICLCSASYIDSNAYENIASTWPCIVTCSSHHMCISGYCWVVRSSNTTSGPDFVPGQQTIAQNSSYWQVLFAEQTLLLWLVGQKSSTPNTEYQSIAIFLSSSWYSWPGR